MFLGVGYLMSVVKNNDEIKEVCKESEKVVRDSVVNGSLFSFSLLLALEETSPSQIQKAASI